MRLLAPFTVSHEEVISALPPWAERVDVSAGPHAYWGAVRDRWVPTDDLVVVEHDVVIHGTVLEQFESCPEAWCTFGYTPICHEACLEAWANMLGCVRFRKELIASCPNALTSIPEERRVWNNLCDEIAGNKIGGVDQPTLRPDSLRAAGYKHHWHLPRVRHRSWEGRE